MLSAKKLTRNPAATRQRLISATVQLMLRQGYSATTVDQICAQAELTKGSFFHHFPSKESIVRAAVEWWGQMGSALYAAAWENPELDPLAMLDRLFEIMIGFTQKPEAPCVCMVGMMSQELARTHPLLREACERELQLWTDNVTRLLSAAQTRHRPRMAFEPEQVAWFLNSLWQGSMLVSKTRCAPGLIRQNLQLARSYVTGLFEPNEACVLNSMPNSAP